VHHHPVSNFHGGRHGKPVLASRPILKDPNS